MKPSKKHLAQAKMRMGDCYRHLGDVETAMIYYQEVVRDFPKTEQGIKSKERISQLSEKKKQKAVR
jgi:TolA-binding protein